MQLEQVAQVVDALGGNAAVAELTGVGPSAVSNWKSWDRFPPRVHHRLFRECERRGLQVNPRLFDDAEHPAEEPVTPEAAD